MNGIITAPGRYHAAEALARLEAMVKARGILEFGAIDLTGEADRAELAVPPTQLLLFGNPLVGTPLMLATPSSAIDFPLEALPAQDSDGKNWLSCNEPVYLQERHGLLSALVAPLAALEALAGAAAGA